MSVDCNYCPLVVSSFIDRFWPLEEAVYALRIFYHVFAAVYTEFSTISILRFKEQESIVKFGLSFEEENVLERRTL